MVSLFIQSTHFLIHFCRTKAKQNVDKSKYFIRFVCVCYAVLILLDYNYVTEIAGVRSTLTAKLQDQWMMTGSLQTIPLLRASIFPSWTCTTEIALMDSP